MIDVTEISEIPGILRSDYLGSLLEPQEFYVENLVRAGQKVLICDSGRPVGYAVTHDATIVEFFWTDSGVTPQSKAFELVLKNSKADRALCKSFDSLMLAAAATKPARTRTAGFLFRRIANASFTTNPQVTVRVGTKDDIGAVLSIHDGFFDDAHEIESYTTDRRLFIYQSRDPGILGCGVFKRILPDQNNFDVGMVVAPAHRRKGVGTYIAAHLKNHCLKAGYRPVCGCSVENVASRASLEKAGFAADHTLVEFVY